jgi:N-acetyltransferase
VDEEPEAHSSSPSRAAAIFSDENVPDWTPPSSPNLAVSQAIVEKYRDMNSPSAATALPSSPPRRALQAGVTGNAQDHLRPFRRKRKLATGKEVKTSPKAPAKTKAKPKTKPLTQMRLDLGQQIQKKCQTCGMEYRPSVAEDKKLHEKFHGQNVDGIPLKHTLGQGLRILEDEEGLYKEEIILPIERHKHSWAAVRKLTHAVLDIVETDLGGVGIEEDRLWGEVQMPGKEGKETTMCDRYKTFIFVRKDKIIGVCLAERIFEAYPVLAAITKPDGDSSSSASDSAIMTSEDAQPATLGISRIWVSQCARGQGIARKLLRFATKRFIYHLDIPREQVAFSQPTESGAKLARKWFGKESGWLVYPG